MEWWKIVLGVPVLLFLIAYLIHVIVGSAADAYFKAKLKYHERRKENET